MCYFYVWGLVFLCFAVSNSYLLGLVFLRFGVSDSYGLGLVFFFGGGG